MKTEIITFEVQIKIRYDGEARSDAIAAAKEIVMDGGTRISGGGLKGRYEAELRGATLKHEDVRRKG